MTLTDDKLAAILFSIFKQVLSQYVSSFEKANTSNIRKLKPLLSSLKNFTVNQISRQKAKGKKKFMNDDLIFVENYYAQDSTRYDEIVVANLLMFLVRYDFLEINF